MLEYFAINSLHLIVSLYVLLGWIATDKRLLLFHILFITVMISHWLTNKNKCFMNEVLYGDNDKDFIHRVLSKFGIKMREKDMVMIQYVVTFAVLVLSIHRFVTL